MVGKCNNPTFNECYGDRKSISHHLFWPKSDYTTELEIAFRNKPENLLQICKCAERLIHETMRPPVKPSISEMIMSLTVEL